MRCHRFRHPLGPALTCLLALAPPLLTGQSVPGTGAAGPARRTYDHDTSRVADQAAIFQEGYGAYVMKCRGSFESESGEAFSFTLRGLVSPVTESGTRYFLGAGHVFDPDEAIAARGCAPKRARNLRLDYSVELGGTAYRFSRLDDRARDFALFALQEGQPAFPTAGCKCGDSDDVGLGNAVLAWGMPLMEHFELGTGIVSALRAPPSLLEAGFPQARAEDFFVTSMPTIFGCSGAPVYAFRGGEPEIIGMLVAGYVNINRSLVYRINSILAASGLR